MLVLELLVNYNLGRNIPRYELLSALLFLA